MGKAIRRLCIAVAMVAVLVAALTTGILAANGENGNAGGDCPYAEDECGYCQPKNYAYTWGSSIEPPGPHGPYAYQHGRQRE